MQTGTKAVMAHTLLLEYLQRDGKVLTWDESEAAVAEIFEPVTKPPLIYMHNWTATERAGSSEHAHLGCEFTRSVCGENELAGACDAIFGYLLTSCMRRSRETGLRIAASRSCESGLSGGSRRRRRRQKHKRHGAAPLDIEPILNDNCGNNTDNALHEQLALLFRENARLQALLKRREASVAQKLSDAQSIAKAITAEQHRTNRIIADLQEKLGRANRFNQHLRKTMG